MSENKPWWVVVERDNVVSKGNGKWKWTELPSYAVGPYEKESDAEAEANSESSQTYCLMTIDAKNEGYAATDCYWTQDLPKNAITISTVPLDEEDD